MIDIRCKVMIVEDAVENQQLLEELLEEDYDLAVAGSAEACMDRLNIEQPDLILLDVGLPGMDGYEACRLLKAARSTRDIPIIFVSAAVSAEERLAGYEAGGDEYVTKPFTTEELLGKIERSLETRQEEQDLKSTIAEAQKIAQQALINSSELGGLNLYMQQSGNATSYEELADHLMRAMRAFGLQCNVLMGTPLRDYHFGCQSDSLEARLLNKHRNTERFIQVQNRIIVNSLNCSILIKNMPLEDQEQTDRLRQYLTIIIDATTARIETLQYIMEAKAQRTGTIRNIIKTNDVQMVRIRDKYLAKEKEQRSIMQNMRANIENQLIDMGLGEEQGNPVVWELDSSIQQIEELPDISQDIESSFKATKAILGRLMDQT